MMFFSLQVGLNISNFYGWFFNFLPTILSVIIILITNSTVLYKLIQKSLKKKEEPCQIVAGTVHTNNTTEVNIFKDDINSTENKPSNGENRELTSKKSSIMTLRGFGVSLSAKKAIFSGQSKTILSLAFVFLVCYAQKVFIYSLLVCWPQKPYHELLLAFMNDSHSRTFFTVSDYCVTINSFLNPIIYVTFSSKVRWEFWQALACNKVADTGGERKRGETSTATSGKPTNRTMTTL